MGTRGIVGFVTPEGVRGSYNHFDSYPSQLGKQVQDQLRRLFTTPPNDEHWDWDTTRAVFARIRWVEGEDTPTDEERERYKALTDATVSRHGEDWYSVLRQAQGDFEAMLTHGVAIASHDFVKNSLFCEWGWLLDLTTDQVVILRGFNTDEDKQAPYARLTGQEIIDQVKENPSREYFYYGCREVWRGSLEDFLALDLEAWAEELFLAEENEADAAEKAAK